MSSLKDRIARINKKASLHTWFFSALKMAVMLAEEKLVLATHRSMFRSWH